MVAGEVAGTVSKMQSTLWNSVQAPCLCNPLLLCLVLDLLFPSALLYIITLFHPSALFTILSALSLPSLFPVAHPPTAVPSSFSGLDCAQAWQLLNGVQCLGMNALGCDRQAVPLPESPVSTLLQRYRTYKHSAPLQTRLGTGRKDTLFQPSFMFFLLFKWSLQKLCTRLKGLQVWTVSGGEVQRGLVFKVMNELEQSENVFLAQSLSYLVCILVKVTWV